MTFKISHCIFILYILGTTTVKVCNGISQGPSSKVSGGEVSKHIYTGNYGSFPRTSCTGKRTIDGFEENGCKVMKIKESSILFYIYCSTIQGLEDLWNKYKDGYWQRMFQECFITEELLDQLKLKHATFTVHMDELEYLECKQSLKHIGRCISTFEICDYNYTNKI